MDIHIRIYTYISQIRISRYFFSPSHSDYLLKIQIDERQCYQFKIGGI